MTDDEITRQREATINEAWIICDTAIKEAMSLRDKIIAEAWVTSCKSIDEAKAAYKVVYDAVWAANGEPK